MRSMRLGGPEETAATSMEKAMDMFDHVWYDNACPEDVGARGRLGRALERS